MADFQTLLRRADLLFDQEKAEEAFAQYDEVAHLLLDKLHQSRNVRRVAKGAGWAAALLTGGFGLEDFLIVPLVNKAVQNMMGVNLEQALDTLRYVLSQKLLLLQTSREVYFSTPSAAILADFLLSYRLSEDAKDHASQWRKLSAVVNPFDPETRVVGAERTYSEEEMLALLEGLVGKNSSQGKYLDGLLFLHLLSHTYFHTSLYHTLRRLYPELEAFGGLHQSTSRDTAHQEERERELHYADLLGLSGKVSLEDIKRAFRKKIKEVHPDRFAQASEAKRREAERLSRELLEAFAFFKMKYGTA
jgi:hypothetical protein